MITVQFSAGENSRFAPGAVEHLIGTETKFNGQPAKILAARVLSDGMAEMTLETATIGPGDWPGLLPGSFSFHQSDDA